MAKSDTRYWNFDTPISAINQAASNARGRSYGLITCLAMMASIVMVCTVVLPIGGDLSIPGLMLTSTYLGVVAAGGLCAVAGRLPRLQALSVGILLVAGVPFSLVLVPVILALHLTLFPWGENLLPEDRRRRLRMSLSLVGMVAQFFLLFWFLSSPMAYHY
jgi:hypothetical protein